MKLNHSLLVTIFVVAVVLTVFTDEIEAKSSNDGGSSSFSSSSSSSEESRGRRGYDDADSDEVPPPVLESAEIEESGQNAAAGIGGNEGDSEGKRRREFHED